MNEEEANYQQVRRNLAKGMTLHIVRKDSELLPAVLKLELEGLAETEIIQFDEQSSEMRVSPTLTLIAIDSWHADAKLENDRLALPGEPIP